MATITVTTALDVVNAKDGVLSLREAVAQANATTAADTILFAGSLEGRTLTLTGGELVLRQDVTIDGDRNGDGISVTIDGGRRDSADLPGQEGSRIFRIEGPATEAVVSDLRMTNGYAGEYGDGGAILVASGSLRLDDCTITGSQSYEGSGGAISVAAGAAMTAIDSSFLGNVAVYGMGGAIHGTAATITLQNSDVSDNGATWRGGGISVGGSKLTISDCLISSNDSAGFNYIGSGGGIDAGESSVLIANSSIVDNAAQYGGGLSVSGDVVVVNSTIAGNRAIHDGFYSVRGGGIEAVGGRLSIRSSTITGNEALLEYYEGQQYTADGGAISAWASVQLEIDNSIIAGNRVVAPVAGQLGAPDISGTITFSNGHNLFGSDVTGNVSGDRENVAPGLIFAAIDPTTGGGLVSATGIVPLRNAITNPALSGADPLAAPDAGQLGGTGRPLPAGSLPDIGSIEISQTLSKTASANNDVLTGTAKANTIDGKAGADFIKGLAGNDTLKGGDGGDVLDGGAGNDKLYGDAGIDLVFYGGSKKVAVDLSLKTDTARRGSETDTLYNVEGAIGSSAADSFKGNEYNNYFQGGGGKDTATGGSGRDIYDFNAIADSKAGASTRDVITDFDHLVDRIDLMGIDADTTVAGNQAFRWVGKAALSGPGEVGYFTSGGNTIIRASNDADTTSEFEIQLTGIKTLTAVDFYL